MTATFNCTNSTLTRIFGWLPWAIVQRTVPLSRNGSNRRMRNREFRRDITSCSSNQAHDGPWALTGAVGLQRGNLSLAKFLAGFPHGTQNRRPIFEISSKNLLDHAMRQLRDQPV